MEACVHEVRAHPGQAIVAANVRRLIDGSRLVNAEDPDNLRVQDSYSLRCAPQVHGASRDTLGFVRSVCEREINSVTDNPLVYHEDGRVISAGNFHGEPIAQALDCAKSRWPSWLPSASAVPPSCWTRRRAMVFPLPGGRKRTQLWSDDCAVHLCGIGFEEQDPCSSRFGRLDSDQCQSGRPCKHGANSALHALEILENLRRCWQSSSCAPTMQRVSVMQQPDVDRRSY